MDDQQRAMELLAQAYENEGGWVADAAVEVRAGHLDRHDKAAIAAITAALRAAPEGFVMVPVEPTREMMDAGRVAVMAEHCAGPKWTPRQHYVASGKPTTGIPEDVLDERGPLTKESTAVMVYGTMLAARPQGVKDGR